MFNPSYGFNSTSEWIHAQLVFTIQSAIITLLITTPMQKLISVVTTFMYVVIDLLGFKYVELNTLDSPLQLKIIEFITTNSYGIQYILKQERFIPNDFIFNYYCYGTYAFIESTGTHEKFNYKTFKGTLFPWTHKHIKNIIDNTSESISRYQFENETTIRVVDVANEAEHGDAQVSSVIVPFHIMKCQKDLIEKIMTSIDDLMKKRSLRGARYMNILLTGPPGSGKTTMVSQLTKKLGGILLRCKSIKNTSVECLKKTISMVKVLGVDSDYLKDYDLKYGTPRQKPSKSLDKPPPIVIIVDEWDSLLSQYIPHVHDDCVKQLIKDGFADEELATAIEDIQASLAQTSKGTSGKAIINEFLDYLTTLDNTITIFISNTSMRQVNKSFLRDGRITHRMQLSEITRDDILSYIEGVAKVLGWKENASDIIAEVLPLDEKLPSLATIVQILELASSPETAAKNIEAYIESTQREKRIKNKFDSYIELAKNGLLGKEKLSTRRKSFT